MILWIVSMKRVFIISLGFISVFLSLKVVWATSGACSGHGGVSCSAGSDFDGSVICYDGWKNSSVSYKSMVECAQPKDSCSYLNPALYGGYPTCNISSLQELKRIAEQQTEADNIARGLIGSPDGAAAIRSTQNEYQQKIDSCQAWINSYDAAQQSYQKCWSDQSQKIAQQNKIQQEYSQVSLNYQQKQTEDQKQINDLLLIARSCKAKNAYWNLDESKNYYCECGSGYQFNSDQTLCVPIITTTPTTTIQLQPNSIMGKPAPVFEIQNKSQIKNNKIINTSTSLLRPQATTTNFKNIQPQATPALEINTQQLNNINVRVKNLGFFKRISNWFLNVFSGNK
ncbi:MAG: hypothetical protein NTV81_00810 [Candidatus Komeilibacteria bacterium]|nr:hypothetical protein [Candidatus Komeilibacteria bacterium]